MTEVPPRPGRAPRPRWIVVGFIAGILVLSLVVSRACREQEVKVSQDDAIATAQQQIDFEPDHTAIRLVRSGIPSRAYWAVSLSQSNGHGGYTHLTTVTIDARTGEVTKVNRER